MISQYLKRTLPFLLLVLVLAGAVAWYLSLRMTGPLEELSQATEKMAQGQWEVETPSSSTLEIEKLSSSFRSLGQQLKVREQELLKKERLSTIGQFGAGIAHEIKNPLNVIGSYAQLLERKFSDDPKAQEQVGVIRSEVDRAARIINELLNYSRQRPLQETTIELKPFLEDLVAKQKVAQDKKIDWQIQSEENLKVVADHDYLWQVVSNLVENAVHAFSEEASDKKIVLTASKANNGGVHIKVKDNGPGIAPDHQKKIFEPFFTTKGAGQGTGLGLALCKSIMELHGGDIRLQPSPVGTEFILALPVVLKKPSSSF